jgi:Zn-dependent protease
MDDPKLVDQILRLIMLAPGFLLGLTVHEFAHGYVAYRLGDPTAKLAGRLTFNPIPHIDPIGALVLVFTGMIGWAKPVPVNTFNLDNPRRDMAWISLAGPAVNLVTALGLALVLHAVAFIFFGKGLGQWFMIHSQGRIRPEIGMLYFGVVVNVGLAIFNLFPLPPLDGSKILAGLLPRDLAIRMDKVEPYGFIILLPLIYFGVVNQVIGPPIKFIRMMLLYR